MKFNIQEVYNWLKAADIKQDPESKELALNLIEEESVELGNAWETDDRQEELDACVDLFWVVTNYLYFAGFTAEEIEKQMNKVSKQNFSKFDTDIEDARKSVEMYKNGTHPNKLGESINTYFKFTNPYFIILRESDNKILKSWKYTESE